VVRPQTMEPVSARLPSDVYAWLAGIEIGGAPTNSDKIRVLLSQIKLQYDGAFDYSAAHAWGRELLKRLHLELVDAQVESGSHSDLLASTLEHVIALLALVVSAHPNTEAAAKQLEDALVKQIFSMANGLLRQGALADAAAFDPAVVRRNWGPTMELATLLNQEKGAKNG
jgi:hypothetical protein